MSVSEQQSQSPTSAIYKKFQQLPQAVRYLLIGGMASAVDVLLFMFLFNIVGTSTLVAHSISVPTSVFVSFITNARHNFHTNDRMVLRLISFAVVCAIGYAAGFWVIQVAANHGVGANIGKILSLPVVFVIQYVLNSKITFHKAAAAA